MFKAGDTNTICDITGFKVKLSDTVKDWRGFQAIPESVSPRHQQDFAPNIIKTKVHKDSRSEQHYNADTILPPDIV